MSHYLNRPSLPHPSAILSTSSTTEDNSNNTVEERINILAERYKTKLCKNYVETGACPYEVRCMFAHGEDELRTAEQNIQDGLTSEEAIKNFQRKTYGGGKKKKSKKNKNKNNTNALKNVVPSIPYNDKENDLYAYPTAEDPNTVIVYTHDPYNAFLLSEEDDNIGDEDYFGINPMNNNGAVPAFDESGVYFPNDQLTTGGVVAGEEEVEDNNENDYSPVSTPNVNVIVRQNKVCSTALLSTPTADAPKRSTILLP